jgi:hypothetical protein
VDAIRVELQLSWTDLFDNGGKVDESSRKIAADAWMPCQTPVEKGGHGCSGYKAAEYRYTDENGKLLYAVARCSRKGEGCKQPFAQWHPDSTRKHGKKWGLPSTIRRVLYNLPKVLEAIKQGRRIWFLEGEKDVERMHADFPDEVATTAPSGAGKSKWRMEYTRYFIGAPQVIIVADCDKPGLDYAEEVHHHIGKLVSSVKVVCTPIMENGADFSDHRNYGLGLDEFEIVPFELVEQRPSMRIQVEKRHTEKPVHFDGFSQEDVERSLIGSMLKYGMHYSVAEADIKSDERLRLAAGAINRIAARGSIITPETVAVEIEASGSGTYERVLSYLIDMEKVAFGDIAKPLIAARILRERSIREGLVYSCRATEEAIQNERWQIDEVLTHLGKLTERHAEEYAELSREYCAPVGDMFAVDVVAEVEREEAEAAASNVRQLRAETVAQEKITARTS